MDIAHLIQTIALYALPVLFAITIHEAAHGYVARHFGDNTAYLLGRVTLNPLKHIDPVGTILMPALMLLSTYAIPGARSCHWLCQTGASALWQIAQPQARHDLGGAGRARASTSSRPSLGVRCCTC